MLSAAQLAEAADAQAQRRNGPQWTERAEDENPGDWLAEITVGDASAADLTAVRAAPRELRGLMEGADPSNYQDRPAQHEPEILAHLETLGRTMAALTEAVARLRTERPSPTGGMGEIPGWLKVAAGDPLTYDAPDPGRTSVCVRVQPTLYGRLQQAQTRLGLRTTAGAWECLLRLGLAVVDRL